MSTTLPSSLSMAPRHAYYADKLASLRELFDGAPVTLVDEGLRVGDRIHPIVDDVIVMLAREHWPAALQARLPLAGSCESPPASSARFAADIQYTFGEEWKTFSSLLPEHEATFHSYFDLVDLRALADQRLCDLGCGMGRWSYFASAYCREIVLVDFSEAIFVARRTLRERSNAIFIMADVRALPFGDDFADLVFSLGVLHHLPTPALEEVRRLGRYAPRLLVYLYYALDNRPWYFGTLLRAVTVMRLVLSRIHNAAARDLLTALIAAVVYKPMIFLGRLVRPLGLAHHVPLYEAYHDQGWRAICQDVYDRFFTPIEQRVSHADVLALRDTFSRITVSGGLPYWHFLCER